MNRSDAGKLGYVKSKDLFDKARAERAKKSVAKWNKEARTCLYCGERIPYEKRKNNFCNRSCSASYNNSQRELKRKACLECGNLTSNDKFCSTRCSGDYNWKYKHKNKFELGMLKSPVALKNAIFKTRFNEKPYCEKCELDTWLGEPINLELHHVDGHSDNNMPDNLLLLCPNCHSMTDTYKNRNKGNGRYARKQRYHSDKSY